MSEGCSHLDFVILVGPDGKYAKGCRLCCNEQDFSREGYQKANLNDETAIKAILNNAPMLNPEYLHIGRTEPTGYAVFGGIKMPVWDTSSRQV